jgi:hypothetical protein
MWTRKKKKKKRKERNFFIFIAQTQLDLGKKLVSLSRNGRKWEVFILFILLSSFGQFAVFIVEEAKNNILVAIELNLHKQSYNFC